jgi:hypothetical protein
MGLRDRAAISVRSLSQPKSDKSDFGWEREPTELAGGSLAQNAKSESPFNDPGC